MIRRNRRRGQSLVEIAVILPLLVVIGAFLFDMAMVANTQMTLNRVIGLTAASATEYHDGRYWNDGEIRSALIANLLPPLAADHLSVDRLQITNDADGRRFVQIDVHYDMPLFTPGLSTMLGAAARISASDRSTFVEPTPVPAVPVAPAFAVQPDGSILVNGRYNARIKILAKNFKNSAGTDVPITVSIAKDGSTFSSAFSGAAVTGGEETVLVGLTPGQKIALRADANLRGRDRVSASYASNVRVPLDDAPDFVHQYVLARGDGVPDHPAFAGPPTLIPELQPLVDTASRTVLVGPKDSLLLWEFNPTLATPGTNFQELVAIVQLWDPNVESRPTTP